MLLILLLGMIIVLLIVIFSNAFSKIIFNQKNKKFSNQEWFQNYLLSGIFLFAINVLLSGITALLIWIQDIPYMHIFLMGLATLISIVIWLIISNIWQGLKRDRFKRGFLGSSFYLIVSVIMIYKLITIKPSYIGEDTFMTSLGLMVVFIISTVAFFTCFFITSFQKK